MPRLVLLLVLALTAPAAAQPRTPLAELVETHQVAPNERATLVRFVTQPTPRVLALGPNGGFGWQWGGAITDEERAQRALDACQRRSGGAPCQVAARDLSVVLPGRASSPPAPPAGIALSSVNRETVPDPRFVWWGPQQARGVLVFAHGRAARGADARGTQPQSWTRHFNNAGYDIWRFDRHPNVDDTDRAAGWLRDDLAELRRRGYRQVIMAGQSRGGWNALMMLATPGLADAVIAIAPAAHGETGSANHARQLDDLRTIVLAAASPQARVAVANFRDDPFDAEPEARAALFRQLGQRSAALLFLDRPEGLTGHGAGGNAVFNDRYGACLLRFATANPPPRGC